VQDESVRCADLWPVLSHVLPIIADGPQGRGYTICHFGWSEAESKNLTRIFVAASVSAQRCFNFAQHDYAPSNQTALSEIAEIAAGRSLHEIDRELEQADLPGVVHAVNDRAERLIFAFDILSGAIDYRVD
jgi:hypothetical protein